MEVPHPALPSGPINSLLRSMGRGAARREGLPWRGQRSVPGPPLTPPSLGRGGPAAPGCHPETIGPEPATRSPSASSSGADRLWGPALGRASPRGGADGAGFYPRTPGRREKRRLPAPGFPTAEERTVPRPLVPVASPQPLCHSPGRRAGRAHTLRPGNKGDGQLAALLVLDGPGIYCRGTVCRDSHTHNGRHLIIHVMGSLRPAALTRCHAVRICGDGQHWGHPRVTAHSGFSSAGNELPFPPSSVAGHTSRRCRGCQATEIS